jgi:hypothetical protein
MHVAGDGATHAGAYYTWTHDYWPPLVPTTIEYMVIMHVVKNGSPSTSDTGTIGTHYGLFEFIDKFN